MWAVEVIVVEVEGETSSAVVAGVIRAGVGPFASNGLDEAFGFAVGLRTIGTGEEMFESQLVAALSKAFGAVGRALVGEEGLDVDVMGFIKGDGLVECGQDAGGFLIGKEGGKGDAGMVIDGDVQAFDACARIAVGAVAGGADAGLMKAAQLFNIEMEEFTGRGAFVAEDWRFGWFEGTEAIEAMALEDAGEGGF